MSRQERVNARGEFQFTGLRAGTYAVVAAVAIGGEKRITLELSPRFADAEGRVLVEFALDYRAADAQVVSVAQLRLPDQARWEHADSRICLQNGNVRGAIAHLRRALQVAPGFAAAWNDLGTLAFQAGDYREAETCFREALEHDPACYPALVNLGGALLARKKTVDSLEVNQRAVRERPGDPLAQSQLGSSYFYENDYDNALVHLNRAKDLDPAHYTYPQILLADIYVRKKNYAAAAAELDEFLKFHPASKHAPSLRERLAEVRSAAGKR
jgi:tetratricopeptide (TPR) repeat protein